MLDYPLLLLGVILTLKTTNIWYELSMEHTFKQGIQVIERSGHLSPILAGGFCKSLEIRLVEVAQVNQAVEFLIGLCRAEALS